MSFDFPAFVDALDVTYNPKDAPTPQLNSLLLSCGFSPKRTNAQGRDLYFPPTGRGALAVDCTARFIRISISGGACEYLRACGIWMDCLFLLSTSPHCVTRLDAAVDFPLDGADLVARMRARHSSGQVSLGRKSINTSVVLSVRPDGRESGTWYAGYRSAAKATAKVYDKALELMQKYGEESPPRGRVEVTAKKGYGATLRDAAMPDAIFWHIASPALVQAPEGIPMWQPNQEGGWQTVPREILPAEVLKRRIEDSAELAKLYELAGTFQGGFEYMRHLINKGITNASIAAGDGVSEAV